MSGRHITRAKASPLRRLSLTVLLFTTTGLLAACSFGDEDSRDDVSPTPDAAREIAVTANNFAFDPKGITVATGDAVAIVFTSVDVLHDFTVDELDVHVAADSGETATVGFLAQLPGRYAFYCSEPGHRDAGMEGALIVER